MKKVGVLVIHGMGTSREDFDEKFQKKLYRHIAQIGKDKTEIAYQKVFWAKYLDQRQKTYFENSRKNPQNNLKWNWLRKFVVGSLSDASAYQRKHGQGNLNYNNIVRKVNRAVHLIKEELESDQKPLIVIAHSLGGFIMNNYIWDAHKIHSGRSADWPEDVNLEGNFEKMVNVTGMFTFGCNIPLFVIGNDPIEAIRFPHPELSPELKSKSRWHNYFDPDDVLGWPLKELKYSFDGLQKPEGSYAYPDVVNKDIAIRAGNILGWTPVSHIDYWTDNSFVKPVAEYISEFL